GRSSPNHPPIPSSSPPLAAASRGRRHRQSTDEAGCCLPRSSSTGERILAGPRPASSRGALPSSRRRLSSSSHPLAPRGPFPRRDPSNQGARFPDWRSNPPVSS
ncbi:hypothetical protein EJB05_37092, partial [Eragrostis curvula]